MFSMRQKVFFEMPLIIILIVFCTGQITLSFKLLQTHIPQTSFIGGKEKLICQYEIDSENGEKLYSLKWYKNGNEFFRFIPMASPKLITLPVSGINIELKETNETLVTLKALNFDSSGIYRCEISADKSLSFKTLAKESNLTIVVPPSPPNPSFSNSTTKVLMNEIMHRNCSSNSSYPKANLTIHINGIMVKKSELIKYPGENTGVKFGDNYLQTSILGIKLRVQHEHFEKGYLKLKCTAKIFDKSWSRELVITHKNSPSFIMNARHRSSYGLQLQGSTIIILLNLLTIICGSIYNF